MIPFSTEAEAGEGYRSAEEQGKIPEAGETGNPEEEPGTVAAAHGPGEKWACAFPPSELGIPG